MANSTATASKMHLIDSAMVLVCLIQDSSAVATFSHSCHISVIPQHQRLWRHQTCFLYLL